jgi:hypothetical protein
MWEKMNNIKYYKKNWYLMVCIKYNNKNGYVTEINPEWEILPIIGENITLINITYNWVRYKSIQLQSFPFSIYFYNITLLITTFYEKNRSHIFVYYFILLIFFHVVCIQLYYLKMAKLAETCCKTHQISENNFCYYWWLISLHFIVSSVWAVMYKDKQDSTSQDINARWI